MIEIKRNQNSMTKKAGMIVEHINSKRIGLILTDPTSYGNFKALTFMENELPTYVEWNITSVEISETVITIKN